LLPWQIKGRSSSKAIAVCVAEVEQIQLYGDTLSLPKGLLHKLLPGPVTIVLKRLESAPVCQSLTADLDTLALRVPGPDVRGMWKRPSGQGLSFCRAIASSAGALALTSANPSNSSSSLSPQEFRPLWGQLAYVFDGGILPSTLQPWQRACLLDDLAYVGLALHPKPA
jgi:tRNA A37 threonylcarbamoyladenosine synthetase subunit TsaC/SUA5/YrdC